MWAMALWGVTDVAAVAYHGAAPPGEMRVARARRRLAGSSVKDRRRCSFSSRLEARVRPSFFALDEAERARLRRAMAFVLRRAPLAFRVTASSSFVLALVAA